MSEGREEVGRWDGETNKQTNKQTTEEDILADLGSIYGAEVVEDVHDTVIDHSSEHLQTRRSHLAHQTFRKNKAHRKTMHKVRREAGIVHLYTSCLPFTKPCLRTFV